MVLRGSSSKRLTQDGLCEAAEGHGGQQTGGDIGERTDQGPEMGGYVQANAAEPPHPSISGSRSLSVLPSTSPRPSTVTFPSEPCRRGRGGQTPKEQPPSRLELVEDTQLGP